MQGFETINRARKKCLDKFFGGKESEWWKRVISMRNLIRKKHPGNVCEVFKNENTNAYEGFAVVIGAVRALLPYMIS